MASGGGILSPSDSMVNANVYRFTFDKYFSGSGRTDKGPAFEVMVFVTRLLAILIGAFIFNNPFYAIGLYGLSGLIVNLVLAMRIITISSGSIIKENYA